MKDEMIDLRVCDNIELTGGKIEYEAISEEFMMLDEKGEEEATLFMVSYLRKGDHSEGRPILFAFNGGPSSSSIFLNIGGMGPKIIDFGDGLSTSFNPPFHMKENRDSILDICDLVFIDPVGCGYSRVLTEKAVKKYASSQEDAKAMICGINSFLSRHKRWNCPIFILGESYGTVRAALMAQQIYENQIGNTCNALNIHVNGLILVGSLLDRDKSLFPVERTITNFPAIAATHWYHMSGEKPLLKEFIDEAENFALRKYLPVLGLGKKATEKEREEVLESLLYFSGLPRDYFDKHGLRLTVEDYVHEIPRETGKIISRYDSRYTTEVRESVDKYDLDDVDPCFERLMPAFTHCYYGIVKEKMGISTERDYQFENMEMYKEWKFDASENPIHFIENAMHKNHELKVMFINGYYDLLTTYSYSEYMINNFALPKERVWHKGYEGGHMSYVGEKQCAEFGRDLRRFVEWTIEK